MLSNRVIDVNKSAITKYDDLVNKREENGIKFYKLNIGQPDFNTNKLYFEVLSKYKTKVNSYSDASGIEFLKESVSLYYKKKIKSDNIVVTQGASDAIIKLLYCICDDGDELLVLEPFFTDYKSYCDLLKINIKVINKDDLNNIEKFINNKTKAILFSNPNNPDGFIINNEIMNNLIKVSKKHNIFIISDEVYSGLVFDKEYKSFINHLDKNIIVVDSSSKKLNLCGSRIGYIILNNKELKEKLIVLNDCRISISNVEQYAVGKMLNSSNIIIREARLKYKNRVQIVINKLKNSDIKYIVPKGGLSMILIFPFDTEKYVEWLISKYENNNKSVLVISGSNFYLSNEGNNKIRICLTTNDKDLEKSMDLLIDSCNKYKGVIK